MRFCKLFLVLLATSCTGTLCAAERELPTAGKSTEPLFSRHIVPLFTKLGCNAGLCHGAVQGKNGFRLSLFGVEPALDHKRLLRDFGGRRLNFQDPGQSLLLQKATGQTAHEGGKRLELGSWEYQLLSSWIAKGALLDRPEQAEIKRLTLTPPSQTVQMGKTFPLRVDAEFADGTVENVTTLCTFESRDKGVAEVGHDGLVRATGKGDTALVARFRSQPIISTVLVPAEARSQVPEAKETNLVDKHIFDKLRKLGVPPSEPCDDATFLRRVFLDVTGAPPTPAEVRSFLASNDPAKRKNLIEDLLKRPGYASLWATKFCDILRPRISYQDFTHQPAPAHTRRFHDWVRARLQENTPYDEFAVRMITATSLEGRTRAEWMQEVISQCEEDGPSFSGDRSKYAQRKTLDLYWHRFDGVGVKGAVQFAHAFLGLRLQCAECHRHPSDVWTQDDLLSFANFFNRVRANTGVITVKEAEDVKKKAGGALSAEEKKKFQDEIKQLADQAKQLQDQAKGKEKAEAAKLQEQARALQEKSGALNRAMSILNCAQVYHAPGNVFGWASVTSPLGTQKAEQFRFLGDSRPVAIPNDRDPRELLADWLRRPDNPYFAKAIVNRMWAHYFGRGLVDPMDDLSPLNPPSHPELMDELCKGFIQNKFDLKWLHRTMLNCRAYQLSHRTNPDNRGDTRNFAYFYQRRLPAEILLESVNQATGTSDQLRSSIIPPGTRPLDIPVSVLDGGVGNKFVQDTFTVFGRPTRNTESLCDCDRDTRPSLLQSLYLANHPELLKKIKDSKGRVTLLVKDTTKNDTQRIEEIYLWTLSRLPTEAEQQICLEHLKKSDSPQKGYEGLLWSLLNGSEFLLNH